MVLCAGYRLDWSVWSIASFFCCSYVGRLLIRDDAAAGKARLPAAADTARDPRPTGCGIDAQRPGWPAWPGLAELMGQGPCRDGAAAAAAAVCDVTPCSISQCQRCQLRGFPAQLGYSLRRISAGRFSVYCTLHVHSTRCDIARYKTFLVCIAVAFVLRVCVAVGWRCGVAVESFVA